MLNPIVASPFEEAIMQVVENADKVTFSDLQARVSAIVNDIYNAGVKSVTK